VTSVDGQRLTVVRVPPSGEDANPARPHQQADHNEHGTPDDLLSNDREHAGNHQDDGHDPKNCCPTRRPISLAGEPIAGVVDRLAPPARTATSAEISPRQLTSGCTTSNQRLAGAWAGNDRAAGARSNPPPSRTTSFTGAGGERDTPATTNQNQMRSRRSPAYSTPP